MKHLLLASVILLASHAWSAAAAATPPLRAEPMHFSVIAMSLEWLTDTSSFIGIYSVKAPATDGFIGLRLTMRLDKALKAQPPESAKSAYYIRSKENPNPALVSVGNQFLVFFASDPVPGPFDAQRRLFPSSVLANTLPLVANAADGPKAATSFQFAIERKAKLNLTGIRETSLDGQSFAVAIEPSPTVDLPASVPQVIHLINLSKAQVTDMRSVAINAAFQVVNDRAEILRLVSDRLRTHPKTMEVRLHQHEFPQMLGSQVAVPVDSAAHELMYDNGTRTLLVPEDLKSLTPKK
jgi:hypothetical protein